MFILRNNEIEGLSDEQSAERLAQHFADSSQQQDVNLLLDHVQTKLKTKSSPSVIKDFEVKSKIIQSLVRKGTQYMPD